MEANAHPGSDLIELPAGAFETTILGADADEGATGDLDIRDDVEISDVSGGGTMIIVCVPDRALHVVGVSNQVGLTSLTVSSGSTATVGGAIKNEGTLTVGQSAIDGNWAEDAVRKKLSDQARRVRDQRWAAVFASLAQETPLIMVRPPRET